MTATLQALGIDRLPVDEQLALVHAIWDHIAETPHPSFLSDAQRADLRRRVAEDDTSPDDTISWEQVQAESPLRARS